MALRSSTAGNGDRHSRSTPPKPDKVLVAVTAGFLVDRVRLKKAASSQVSLLEDELKRKLGTKVHIRQKGKGGRIEIEYYSPDEFDRLLELLRG